MWPVRVVRAYMRLLWWFCLFIFWLVRAILAAGCGFVTGFSTLFMVIALVIGVYKKSLYAFAFAGEFFVLGLVASGIGLLMGDVFFVHPILAWVRRQQTR
jgi:hypothetical protein